MKDNLFTPVEIQLDKDKKVIGNYEGMALLEQLDHLKGEFNSLRADNSSLQVELNSLRADHSSRMQPLHSIRAQILDEWSGFTPESPDDLRLGRNAAAHGGNILEDYHIIKQIKKRNSQRATAWIEAFSRQYGVRYSNCSLIEKWPGEVAEIYDIVVNVNVLDRWASREKEWKEIIDSCKGLLRTFRCEREVFLKEGSESSQQLDKMRSMYYSP